MKIVIRIPEHALIHGRPVEESVQMTIEVRVLKVIRSGVPTLRGPLDVKRRGRYRYGAIVEMPDCVVLPNARRTASVVISKRLNPRWIPPEFPNGSDTLDVGNES
ncbi:hypothetical protein [Burkholderia gladioli]|uniref:hypothetical protein n=1 Tax=Burkholderia gladioli TaxID=28095 RepID=UPI00164025BF|nr:hypothetical protein [Burkholderia gladioli]